ncbi:hypothetical protein H5410_060563 [Solanum commersonii]|uniref:Uncharacterized protein n=1 Tax=Solanum commersonii TaxID=4109 RepID=A0A9J5W5E7_SOLCO|nr:hypothetical protein H5410_060563 [Solanum commersonii]
MDGLQLREVIMPWIKHEGKKTSVTRIIRNVTRNMYMLARLRQPHSSCPVNWSDMLIKWTSCRLTMKGKRVLWEFPPNRGVKYNTDGASRRNLDISSYAFLLRNDKGDIKYAE